jgi:hypothetical protein
MDRPRRRRLRLTQQKGELPPVDNGGLFHAPVDNSSNSPEHVFARDFETGLAAAGATRRW